MDVSDVAQDVQETLLTAAQIQQRVEELGKQLQADYADKNPILIGVLKGAVMFMADLTRALHMHVETEWMAVSSYGTGTRSSGVVRILKDLDRDITDRHVIIVEDIVDSGLTLSWLMANLGSRGAASVEVCALLYKARNIQVPVEVRYVGFEIPDEFVVGYGLDYADKYRNLQEVVTLAPHVYQH